MFSPGQLYQRPGGWLQVYPLQRLQAHPPSQGLHRLEQFVIDLLAEIVLDLSAVFRILLLIAVWIRISIRNTNLEPLKYQQLLALCMCC